MRPTVLSVAAALAILAPRGAVANNGGTQARLSDAVLIKEAVVAGAVLSALHPELGDGDFASKQLWKLSRLVVAFDTLDSADARRQLVSLASYYLGEATNELYQCVLLRKGTRVRKLLTDLAASGKNECESTLLPQLGERPQGSPQVCATTKEMLGRIASVLDRIAKHEQCELEP